MRCVGRRGEGEVKKSHSGGMKRWRMLFQGRDMYAGRCDENKGRYKSIKNKARKAVSKATREKALAGLKNYPHGMFRLVRGLNTDSIAVEGGRCMRGSDGKLCFSEKERGKLWKDYMERIKNKEDDRDHNVEGDAVEVPVVCVSREEVLQALSEMKIEKAPGPSEVSLELIAASGGVWIQVMAEICQRVLDGFGMPVEWALSIVVSFFKEKGDFRNCSCYRAVKLLGRKDVRKKVFFFVC